MDCVSKPQEKVKNSIEDYFLSGTSDVLQP
jgi:hypothetical protein